MGGSEHDGGSVVPPMQAPQRSHVTGRLPYDWGFRPPRGPPEGPKRGPRGAHEGPREGPKRAPRGPIEANEPAKEEKG